MLDLQFYYILITYDEESISKQIKVPKVDSQSVLRYPKNRISRAQSKIQTFFKCLDPSKLISVKIGC